MDKKNCHVQNTSSHRPKSEPYFLILIQHKKKPRTERTDKGLSDKKKKPRGLSHFYLNIIYPFNQLHCKQILYMYNSLNIQRDEIIIQVHVMTKAIDTSHE